jgi:repressor of nif and glnA expression
VDSITQRQMQITGVFPGNRGRGLMQLEDAHIVEITKMLVYASIKVDPLI